MPHNMELGACVSDGWSPERPAKVELQRLTPAQKRLWESSCIAKENELMTVTAGDEGRQRSASCTIDAGRAADVVARPVAAPGA